MVATISTPVLFALLAFGQLVALIMVPLRVVARYKVVYQLAAEDYFMIVAEIFNLAQGGVCSVIAYAGAGKHYSQLKPEQIRLGLMFWYIAMPIYPIVVMLIKLSISLLLLRLMPLRWQKTIIYVVMAVTVLITPVQIGICLGICSHPSDWWNRDPERCDINSYKATVYIHSIISICTDVVLAVMPAIVLSRSQLPKKQKIATAGILAIGTCAGFVTVIKVVFAHQVDLNDYLYTSTWLGFSSAFETCLGITAGCLATFRPFFTKVKGRNMRRADSVGADGRLSFSKEMGAETIRGDWDPGLTITFDPELDEEVERAPSISPSRRSSDISLPIQAHKDFEHVPDNNGWTFRKLII